MKGRTHAVVLWILLSLFVFRVTAQLAAALIEVPLLPPFEAWHSGALPYALLLASQIGIIALYAWMARGITRGSAPRKRGLGRLLLVFGTLYFVFMIVRLVLGMTVFGEPSWWHAPIPSLFHLVLAGFLMVAGHFHARP